MSVSFEIKSAQLPLVALLLKTTDITALARDLNQQFGPDGESPDFFDQDALVLDFSYFEPATPCQDIAHLLDAVRDVRWLPLRVRST